MVSHTKYGKKCKQTDTHTTFSNAVRSVEQGGNRVRIGANSRCRDQKVSQCETKLEGSDMLPAYLQGIAAKQTALHSRSALAAY